MGDCIICGKPEERRGHCPRHYRKALNDGSLIRLNVYRQAGVRQSIARMRAWDHDPLDFAKVAWAAGLFEGEGTFVTNGKAARLYPRAQMTTTDFDVMQRYAKIVGFGKLYYSERVTVTGKSVIRWCVSGYPTSGLIVLFWPWLGDRRRARAIQILREWREAHDGDIGKKVKEKRIYVPMPATAPVPEPSPDPEPVKEPA